MVDLRLVLARTMIASTLPTAAASLEGRVITVQGTGTTESKTYTCEYCKDGNYKWVETVGGGIVATYP